LTARKKKSKIRVMSEQEIIILFCAGALGALLKDIMEDGSLVLPKCSDGKIFLGFMGGIVIGGAAGYLVDGNPITAFLAGYAGTSAIENLISQGIKIKAPEKTDIETMIRSEAIKTGVDPDLAVRVAKCESGLVVSATHSNDNGSIDRGLYQINNKAHPEVTDEQAFDPEFSTKFFCDAVKKGCLRWWNATKTCWDK
jgi:hypothetical protein